MKVLLSPKVQGYMQRLVSVLYEKNYFSYEEEARKYVKDLYDDIQTTLPARLHKPAPQYYDKYEKGMYYAVFRKSKHTHYYVFFLKYVENEEIVYVVCYIGNNHTDAQHLK